MDRFLKNCTPEQSQRIEKLFRDEYKNMVQFAANLLGERSLAEEAAQEAFLIALKKPDRLCESRNPTGWLYNTMKNVILHMERDRNYMIRKNISLYEIKEEHASYRDRYSELDAEICQSEEWDLLTQFYFEGYSIDELSKKYNISKAACKSRLKRARAKLRKLLE